MSTVNEIIDHRRDVIDATKPIIERDVFLT
jgi:hypothetical protein